MNKQINNILVTIREVHCEKHLTEIAKSDLKSAKKTCYTNATTTESW